SYLEVELGPWGHHLALQLSGVRQVAASGLPLDLRVSRSHTWWAARASFPAGWLPPPPWRAAAFALHGGEGARAYLSSLTLQGAAPDFHQPARFPGVGGALPEAAPALLVRTLTAAVQSMASP